MENLDLKQPHKIRQALRNKWTILSTFQCLFSLITLPALKMTHHYKIFSKQNQNISKKRKSNKLKDSKFCKIHVEHARNKTTILGI